MILIIRNSGSQGGKVIKSPPSGSFPNVGLNEWDSPLEAFLEKQVSGMASMRHALKYT